MQNWGTPMGQALISDLDGNGIPDLILVTNQILDIQDNDGSVSQEPACVFSVYTYGESGLQTLISDWPTRCVIAGGNDLVIGADSRWWLLCIGEKPPVQTLAMWDMKEKFMWKP